MEKHAVHEASEQERAQAIQVRIRVFVEIQGFPLNVEIDDQDQVAKLIVVLAGDKVVGTLRILKYGEEVKISRVAILPEYQGKGLGKKLLEYAEQFIATNEEYTDCKFTKLSSRYDKREFYQKCGYVVKGSTYSEFNCLQVWMYKAINRS
ncbi:Acetyltransferase (GNAT) domain [Dipsacomyces acuminosporus]|nr:Acetyltransferase (GNAT) domain [Dipsacomyces acuminosporus]